MKIWHLGDVLCVFGCATKVDDTRPYRKKHSAIKFSFKKRAVQTFVYQSERTFLFCLLVNMSLMLLNEHNNSNNGNERKHERHQQ